ncbi:MAG: HNH endonuclease, partial [Halobaculum sp.]
PMDRPEDQHLRVMDHVATSDRTTTDGEPYLEVHHLHRLSDDGPDHPDNVIALCPTCHARVHHGSDGDEFNEQLIERVASRSLFGDR